MTTALVTKVSGQDGILAARRLAAERCRVVGTVRPGWSSPLSVYLDGVELVEVDLRDPDAMGAVVRDLGPDEVYHLAGATSVADSFAAPDLVAEVNDRAVARLIDSCRHHAPSAKVFLASSAEIFGPDVVGPRSESTPMDPRSPYAESKVRVHEHAAQAREDGLFVAVGILFNHESPIRDPRFVTRKITRAVAAIAAGVGEPLTLGNLDVSRDWGAAVDTVDAMIKLVRAEQARDVVVATGELHTIGDLVEAAFAAAGVSDPWNHVEQDPALMRANDTPGAIADVTVAREWLGWAPTTAFSVLVDQMVSADRRRLDSGVAEDPAYLN